MDKHSDDSSDEPSRTPISEQQEGAQTGFTIGRVFGKQEQDVEYRHRLFHTTCIWISMFAVGWRNALVGPTFPDLRIIIDKDLSTSSWLFTAKSLGGLIGSILGGFAYDRFNKIFMFMLFVWGMGVAAGVTPWCYNFVAMLLAHVMHGICAAAIDTAATADVTVIWKYKSGPYMQAIHSAFSIAGIISPLVAEPFLAEKLTPSYQYNTTNVSISTNLSISAVLSFENASTIPTVFYNRTGLTDELSNSSSLQYGETFVYIPFTLTALICLVSGFLYLVVSCLYGNVYRRSEHLDSVSLDSPQDRYFLTLRMKVIFTIVLGLTMVFYILSENCFIGFLMTFVISELNWSKADGSTASSLFWITFSVGRLCGIVIVKFISLSKVIAAFFGIMSSSAVLFLLAVIYDEGILIWISVGISGFGMSVVFGSVFSWLSKNVRRLTGKITSVIFIFMTSSNMVIPILIGYLMDKVSLMWFIYSQLILISAMCICFAFVYIFFNVLKTIHKRSMDDVQHASSNTRL